MDSSNIFRFPRELADKERDKEAGMRAFVVLEVSNLCWDSVDLYFKWNSKTDEIFMLAIVRHTYFIMNAATDKAKSYTLLMVT